MRAKRFEWEGSAATAAAVRGWAASAAEPVDVAPIERAVVERGDAALRELTARLDATEAADVELEVPRSRCDRALAELDASLREAMETAAANIRAVAEAQIDDSPRRVQLPQGQTVTVRQVPVGSVGIYAPGGRAAYPSSVLMCAIPALAAGVGRIALASPPRPDGTLHPLVLAAAALAEVHEVYALGGAQAIFALAHGTETVSPVDVVAGPGNNWVREAKRAVSGRVGIDSLAGPSELMVIADASTDPAWAALDLCAQAEHGGDGLLVAAAADPGVLASIEEAVGEAAVARPGVGDAPLALVATPDEGAAVKLANRLAPEHLQLMGAAGNALAARVRTAGCVFVGPHSATALGDYAAGSNHVLPTGGAGRFSGPLGPRAFRRSIAAVEVPAAAASKLAPVVDRLARAEGFPVHAESAMIRSKSDG